MTRRTIALAALLIAAAVHPAAAQQAEVVEYYAQDAIGSIRIVFDAAGGVTGRQDYDPFGRRILIAVIPKQGFGAQDRDDETSQANFHARMFQDRIGRFTRPDPVRGHRMAPQTWNRYAYALNSPLRRRDFGGLCPTDYCEEVIVKPEPNGGAGDAGNPATGDEIDPQNPGDSSDGNPLGDPPEDGPVGGEPPQDTPKGNPKDDPPPTPTPTPDCPPVPLFPKNANLGQNLSAVDRAKALFGKHAFDWWYDRVRNAAGRRDQVESGLSWDYKQLGIQFEAAGNYNFGATGQRLGLSYGELVAGSAGAHVKSHRAKGFMPENLFQEVKDWGTIRAGFVYAKNGCSGK